MNRVLETLFFAVSSNTIQIENYNTIFINSFYHSMLDHLDKSKLYLQQSFYPAAENLRKHGYSVYDSCKKMCERQYDLALVVLPKNIVEARYLIAQGILALKDNGMFVCAADNKAGGRRIKKLLQDFGFEEPVICSRNRARAGMVTVNVDNSDRLVVNRSFIKKAIDAGEMQPILGGRFISQPGIYGWDKIDNGSQILVENLPTDLKGRVADFGCGYGYLSVYVLDNIKDIEALSCVDADKRALTACQKNVQTVIAGKQCEVECLWGDLTDPECALKDLDHIVMNPPFHEGKAADITIGKAFISRAYESLHDGGKLWMVANKHLPYEQELSKLFAKVHKKYEGQGFKTFEVVK